MSKNAEESKNEDDLSSDLEKLMLTHSGLAQDEKEFNLIDCVPKIVQVAMAKHWKNKDTSKIKDYKEVEQTSDWTYSTPYKGTVRYLSISAKKIFDETTLQLDCDN